MILDKIDENRLLIALSSEDLKFLDVSINRLNWKYEFSSEIINNLLAKAESEIGFLCSNKKLLIEAIPQSNGCFVLVTLLSNRLDSARKIYKIKNKSKPFAFFFKTPDSLFALIERLYNGRFSFFDSSIIEIKNSYFLVLYIKGAISSNLLAVISEYGRFAGKSAVAAARLVERGNVIIKNRAIEELGKYLLT